MTGRIFREEEEDVKRYASAKTFSFILFCYDYDQHGADDSHIRWEGIVIIFVGIKRKGENRAVGVTGDGRRKKIQFFLVIHSF